MARVTVEDCLERVENRFALVLLASQRTRQLMKGQDSFLEDEGGENKEAVTALREIAEGLVTLDHMGAMRAQNAEVEAAERTALAENAAEARAAALARLQSGSSVGSSPLMSDMNDGLRS